MVPRTLCFWVSFGVVITFCFVVFGSASSLHLALTTGGNLRRDRVPKLKIQDLAAEGKPQFPAVHRTRPKAGTPCKSLTLRKEWRDLTPSHRREYIEGIKCLQNTRSHNASLPSKFTRFDDFVYAHAQAADLVHGVGQFLPWHRHYGWLFEEALREECGYRGSLPYWDWTRDTGGNKPISESPIFDDETGFGGDGTPGTYTPPMDDDGAAIPLFLPGFKGCLQTGPFANTTVHVGPNLRLTDHCLTRGFFLEDIRELLTPPVIAQSIGVENFDDFWHSLEVENIFPPRVHGAMHVGIGGDMVSYYTSPNEPIFHLHHASLDRLWWQWQHADLPNRLYQVGGRMLNTPPFGVLTLDYQLPFAGFVDDVPIRDTMDAAMEPYCFTY